MKLNTLHYKHIGRIQSNDTNLLDFIYYYYVKKIS